MLTNRKMVELQNRVAHINSNLLSLIANFEAVGNHGGDMRFDVVTGYLHQASEDVRAMAEAALAGRSMRELNLLSELAVRSAEEFHSAFQLWKEQCLH